MADRLKLLVIEDSQADFLLIERHLVQHGRVARCQWATTIEDVERELDRERWDVVLADYAVPGLDFFDCLNLLLARLPDAPVIVVSGTIGEERAVELLKAGASDLVLKDSLGRLEAAIDRGLREVAGRRARRAAEAELRLANAALNASADAAVITDRNGTIMWVNPAFNALVGYTSEEAIGRNPRDLVKSGVHDVEVYRGLWNTILAGHVWRGEITNRRRDGQLYPEAMTITPVRDARGEITHFVAIKRDLTAERELRAQLLQAQKMESVGRLAGGIAHDFNNLITVINVTSDLAALSLPGDDRLRADFARIRESGERAASLTQQLLAFSRKQLMKPAVLDLGVVVRDLEGMLRRVIGEDIDLLVAPSERLGCVLADRGQIEQVLMNLVVNARDAMPTGGRLTLRVANVDLDDVFAGSHPSVVPGPHVVLAVSDTGVGMDAATKASIFEPFFTTKETGKGTGLGLATVYGIVKQSGGSIWVESEPGQGATFEIYLPRVEACHVPARARPTPTAMRGDEVILVVEDEEMLRTLCRRLLEVAGYTVLTAGTGEEALRVLENHDGPIHLVLADVVMPGISGRELADRLQRIHPGLKILYTSGYTDDVTLRHGLRDRTTHFIGKPFSMRDLTRKVREVLDA